MPSRPSLVGLPVWVVAGEELHKMQQKRKKKSKPQQLLGVRG